MRIHIRDALRILADHANPEPDDSPDTFFLTVVFDENGGEPAEGAVHDQFANQVIPIESSACSLNLIFNEIGWLKAIEVF